MNTEMSELHHWNKYHNPTPSGFMAGAFYLGTACCNCKFAEAEKVIRKEIEIQVLRDASLAILNNDLSALLDARIAQLEEAVQS